ncbi:MAG TPA: hypothetical protein VEA92_00410 [Candidatus Paceibacterota bacterium]|nr:hypothetical protein [Candidatus Paceibacterota bacterium]
MKADALFFLAIFVFIFVAWVSTGGPKRPISFAGPFITPVTNTGQEQEGYGSWRAALEGEDNWWNGAWSGFVDHNPRESSIGQAQEDLADAQRALQEARLFGPASVYKDIVTLSANTGALAADDPDEEYLTISVSGRAEGPISMSGWRLVSVRTKESATLPSAVSVFRSGSVNQTTPLALSPGERAIVSTGRSPVGASFRENSCSGYLSARQDFVPELAKSCPSPMDDFERFYSGSASDYQACKTAVQNGTRCERPSQGGASNACDNFIREHYSYNGCVTYHASDRNFFGSTWRLYLGESRDDLWPTRNETIKLLDAAGNTVDIVTY